MANDFSGDANCVALYNFANGDFTTDSIGGNTLTDNNAVGVEAVDFKTADQCADFNGTDEFFSVADGDLDAGFPFKSGDTHKKISVCFWMKIGSLDATSQYQVSKYSTADADRSWAAYIVGTSDWFKMIIGYNSGASFQAYDTFHALVTGRWYHVGVRFQDSDKSFTFRIWDDTASSVILDFDDNFTQNIWIDDADFCIGARESGSSYFDGLLDEVVIFKDILTDAEIDEIRAGTYGAAAGTNLQLNIGDAWKEVDAMQINIGDVWKDVAGAQINIGDAWKEIF